MLQRVQLSERGGAPIADQDPALKKAIRERNAK